MTSVARLIIRLTVGGLLAGHGAQKLFGMLGGSGLQGTAGWMELMNLRPGRQWAIVAGGSEFAGGLLTVLGVLNPLGPIMAMGAMLMATLKVHLGKPIWVTAGGAELPVVNMAVLFGMFLAGPGKLSVDAMLGIRLPRWFSVAALLATVGVTLAAAGQSGVADAADAADGDDEDLEAGAALAAGGHGDDDASMRLDEESSAPSGPWGSADPGGAVPLVDDDVAVAAMQGTSTGPSRSRSTS